MAGMKGHREGEPWLLNKALFKVIKLFLLKIQNVTVNKKNILCDTNKTEEKLLFQNINCM
jgi:hypothetical protein